MLRWSVVLDPSWNVLREGSQSKVEVRSGDEERRPRRARVGLLSGPIPTTPVPVKLAPPCPCWIACCRSSRRPCRSSLPRRARVGLSGRSSRRPCRSILSRSSYTPSPRRAVKPSQRATPPGEGSPAVCRVSVPGDEESGTWGSTGTEGPQ